MKKLHDMPGRLALFLLGLGLALSAATARSEVVEWLYQVTVPVADQSPAAQSEASSAALAEVLVRVSGVAPLPESAALAGALRAPERYYSQFRYVAPTPEAPELKARFDFASGVILDLAKQLQLPVWWANRPRVVPWVLVRDGAERVVTANLEDPFAAALADRARQRGVPMQLPQADEQGEAPVPVSSIARNDQAALTLASGAYDGEALVVAQVTRRGGRLLARGSLMLDGEAIGFQTAAVDLAGLGAATADAIAEELAARFAARGGGGLLALRLHGVTNPTDYAVVLGYLRGLEFIDRISLDALSGSVLSLSVASQAGADRFLQLLTVDGMLAPLALDPVRQGPGTLAPPPVLAGPALDLRYLGAAIP
jgi:hypothetical protein